MKRRTRSKPSWKNKMLKRRWMFKKNKNKKKKYKRCKKRKKKLSRRGRRNLKGKIQRMKKRKFLVGWLNLSPFHTQNNSINPQYWPIQLLRVIFSTYHHSCRHHHQLISVNISRRPSTLCQVSRTKTPCGSLGLTQNLFWEISQELSRKLLKPMWVIWFTSE